MGKEYGSRTLCNRTEGVTYETSTSQVKNSNSNPNPNQETKNKTPIKKERQEKRTNERRSER